MAEESQISGLELCTYPDLKGAVDEVLREFASIEYQRSVWLSSTEPVDCPSEMYSTLYDDFHFEEFAREAARKGEPKYLVVHYLIDGYFDEDQSDFDPIAILNDPFWMQTVAAVRSALK